MKKIISIIKKSKRVGIIAHISPDPDCMSSMTALSYILNALNKKCKMFIDCTKMPSHSQFYNLSDEIMLDINSDDFDLLIAVDCATSRLIGKHNKVFEEFSNTIVIDHHKSRDLMGKAVYVAEVSSCSEIIYKIAKELKIKITAELATILLAGIMGDTNCFENDNTNANTLQTASELYKYGADYPTLTFEFKKHTKLKELNLKKLAYNNMTVKKQVGYVILTTKMFDEVETDNCGDLVNELLNLDDNKFAFVIKQKEKNFYVVSLRCKKGFNVAKIAEQFGGGGHIQASGMNFVGAPVKHSKLLYDECQKQLKEIKE